MKKRYITAAVLLIFILLAPLAGSLAFFTQRETAHSVITTGNVDIEIQEFTDQRDEQGNLLPFKDLSGVMPGETVSKIVQIKNTGTGEAWVRLALTPEFIMDLPDSGADTGMVTLNINEDDWEMGEDNFLYYKQPLKPEETTSPALHSLTFSSAMGSKYQESRFVLEVQAQAVQAKNNGETVLTASGWPATA